MTRLGKEYGSSGTKPVYNLQVHKSIISEIEEERPINYSVAAHNMSLHPSDGVYGITDYHDSVSGRTINLTFFRNFVHLTTHDFDSKYDYTDSDKSRLIDDIIRIMNIR